MTALVASHEAILGRAAAAGRRRASLALAVACASALALWFTGFFDAARFADGAPTLAQLFSEMVPPDFSRWRAWAKPLAGTLAMSVAGTALAVVLSLPLALLAARNTTPNVLAYHAARTLLSLLRSVPELIMGIVFVAAVGFGALPGVLALALHSVGMVAKFYAEAIEHADAKPLEAARAAGATPVQVITHAVLPQVIPQLADITIYRWESHYRASTVLGIVGAGGIGFELIAALRLIAYDQVSAILLTILACVLVVDGIGAWLRRRLKWGMIAGPMAHILVTNWIDDDARAFLAGLGSLDAPTDRSVPAADDVRRRAAAVDAMMAFMPDSVDEAFLAAAPRLRIVACALKGFDNFDVDACTRRGVWVSIVPDLLTAPTAELAIGLAIGLGRHVREGDGVVRSGAFAGWRPALYGTGFAGATVAILGLGRLGRAIAERLSGFGCRIVGHDLRDAAPPGVTPLPLAEALAAADLVIVALPLTAGTRGLIGAEALARMKPGALLVNIGRGSTVDEEALADALASGRLGGYAADVFAMEDWALADRPRTIPPALLAHPRTLFTPHLGSAVADVRAAIAMAAALNIADALAGRRPRDAINELAVARRA
jgi:phosphonate transport system permease protein